MRVTDLFDFIASFNASKPAFWMLLCRRSIRCSDELPPNSMISAIVFTPLSDRWAPCSPNTSTCSPPGLAAACSAPVASRFTTRFDCCRSSVPFLAANFDSCILRLDFESFESMDVSLFRLSELNDRSFGKGPGAVVRNGLLLSNSGTSSSITLAELGCSSMTEGIVTPSPPLSLFFGFCSVSPSPSSPVSMAVAIDASNSVSTLSCFASRGFLASRTTTVDSLRSVCTVSAEVLIVLLSPSPSLSACSPVSCAVTNATASTVAVAPPLEEFISASSSAVIMAGRATTASSFSLSLVVCRLTLCFVLISTSSTFDGATAPSVGRVSGDDDVDDADGDDGGSSEGSCWDPANTTSGDGSDEDDEETEDDDGGDGEGALVVVVVDEQEDDELDGDAPTVVSVASLLLAHVSFSSDRAAVTTSPSFASSCCCRSSPFC
uniref:Uncharacterized protein n=1 Tax=Anopheles coluzzii TaxID=1518534 RepID=A0A8W7PNG6_ANOCL